MCSACSGDYENPDRTATGEEVEEAVRIQTRIPQNPVRNNPEQSQRSHPIETLEYKTWKQLFECGVCGAEVLIEEDGQVS
jgi:hypothetical protein